MESKTIKAITTLGTWDVRFTIHEDYPDDIDILVGCSGYGGIEINADLRELCALLDEIKEAERDMYGCC